MWRSVFLKTEIKLPRPLFFDKSMNVNAKTICKYSHQTPLWLHQNAIKQTLQIPSMPLLPLLVFHYDSPWNSAPVNLDSQPALVFLALHSCSWHSIFREFLLPSLHRAMSISLSFKSWWNLPSSIKTFLVHYFWERPLSAPKRHGISLLQNSLDQLDWAWVFLAGAQLLNHFPI